LHRPLVFLLYFRLARACRRSEDLPGYDTQNDDDDGHNRGDGALADILTHVFTSLSGTLSSQPVSAAPGHGAVRGQRQRFPV
jgi:hypothetical protein